MIVFHLNLRHVCKIIVSGWEVPKTHGWRSFPFILFFNCQTRWGRNDTLGMGLWTILNLTIKHVSSLQILKKITSSFRTRLPFITPSTVNMMNGICMVWNITSLFFTGIIPKAWQSNDFYSLVLITIQCRIYQLQDTTRIFLQATLIEKDRVLCALGI